MISLETGYLKLVETIAKGENGYHKDYKRVNELAAKYKTLITGDGVDGILKRYNPRESKDQFEQRIRITQNITPAIAEKIMSPFNKVSRIDNIEKRIIFKDENSGEKKRSDLLVKMDEFWGDESLDDWLETRLLELVFTDPNSFLVVEFNEFDPKVEKASPFPYEVSSKEAINYSYTNNKLDFLIVEKPITFKEGADKKVTDGNLYLMYLPEYVIKLTQTDKDTNVTGFESLDELLLTPHIIEIDGKKFIAQLFNPQSKEVQAIRLGYKRDLVTNGRTTISPIHSAVPRMIKCIKAVSELDLTTTLHTFPQKIQFSKKCTGFQDELCRDGKDRDGGTCKACKGSGVVRHTSSSDVIDIPMPKDPKDLFDISKIISYKSPPVDLIKFQDEYVSKLETQAIKDVFVSEAFNRITATVTATEKELDMESVYDTLFAYSNKFSTIWIKIVGLIAEFTDSSDGLSLEHKFPKDFKLKTVNALMNDLKEAKESNAPSFLKVEIQNDIANKVYADNPDAMKRYKIKQQHIPFSGKSPEEIQIVISLNLTRKQDKVLYANFDSIFEEIEKEQFEKQSDFYQMPYDERVKLIDEKVSAYITSIDESNNTAFQLPTVE